jgi:hypothetical protein
MLNPYADRPIAPDRHQTTGPLNLGLFMFRMAPATRTELLDRELFGLPLLVLAGGVIAPLASVARQPD